MSVLEMQSPSRQTTPWSEVCATEHSRSSASGLRPREDSRIHPVPRTLDRGRPATTRSVAPGRRVLVRSASPAQARSCRVEVQPASPVVDDVPTWALLACGVVFGILMLLALALLGGPAYA
ncbi:hypothetical protein [Dietzia sp. PP-33]|uniref:hypothetical protein n=1 Tax=Dietzia sp. PP-33 TaxID=2957500 RepID=UPI0029A9CE6D|nr:hypothetical protein [Dietzia sp. PP-33]MDX2355562.1 hypothetical protein [Dietzia sp. PP-33]